MPSPPPPLPHDFPADTLYDGAPSNFQHDEGCATALDTIIPSSYHHQHHHQHLGGDDDPHVHRPVVNQTSQSRFAMKKKKKKNTLTLYDWDDTFLPSTYLAALGLHADALDDIPEHLATELASLENAIIDVLNAALKSEGVVKIVTNADAGWIEVSGSRFLPRLMRFLQTADIKLVSARSLYEAAYPNAPSSWKIAAFAEEVKETFPDTAELNILVFGDSVSERDAAHALASSLPAACVKSVKLVERPNILQLQRQLSLLCVSFGDLREHHGSFDVNLLC